MIWPRQYGSSFLFNLLDRKPPPEIGTDETRSALSMSMKGPNEKLRPIPSPDGDKRSGRRNGVRWVDSHGGDYTGLFCFCLFFPRQFLISMYVYISFMEFPFVHGQTDS